MFVLLYPVTEENKQHEEKKAKPPNNQLFDSTDDILYNLMSLVCQDTSDVPETPILWVLWVYKSLDTHRAPLWSAEFPADTIWTLPTAALSPSCGWITNTAKAVQSLDKEMGPSAHSSDTWLAATAQEDSAYLPSCSGRLHTHLAYHKSEIKIRLLKSFSLQLTQIHFTSCLVTASAAGLSLQLIAGCVFRSTNSRFKPRWWWCLRPWC